MDSTSDKKPTDPSENPSAEPGRVHVPVSVTVLVPVDVEGFELDEDAIYGELAGIDAVDVSEASGAAELLAAAMRAANESEDVSDAMACLMAGAQAYRKDHPTHKTLLTAYRGVIEEIEI